MFFVLERHIFWLIILYAEEKYILKNNNYYVNDEEKVYLTMHIQRVINVAREKDK